MTEDEHYFLSFLLFLPRSRRCLPNSPQWSFVASCAVVCSRTRSSPPVAWVSRPPSLPSPFRIGLSVTIWLQAMCIDFLSACVVNSLPHWPIFLGLSNTKVQLSVERWIACELAEWMKMQKSHFFCLSFSQHTFCRRCALTSGKDRHFLLNTCQTFPWLFLAIELLSKCV